MAELMRSILCCFGWHWWTPWDKPRLTPDGHGVQYRTCKVCNRQQRHVF